MFSAPAANEKCTQQVYDGQAATPARASSARWQEPHAWMLHALGAGVKQKAGDGEIFRPFHTTRGACNDFQGRELVKEAASRKDAERTFVAFAFILHRFKASQSSARWQA